MSPDDGFGSSREAAPVLDRPRAPLDRAVPRQLASWSSACSRSPANVSGASLRTGVAGSAAASAGQGRDPGRASRAIWSRRMPATR